MKEARVLQVINSLVSAGAEKLVADMVLKFKQKGQASDVFLLRPDRTHLYQKLEDEAGIRILPSLRNASMYNPLHIFRIKKVLPQYDIVHVHLFPAVYWVALANLLSRRRHGNIVLTEHSTDNKRRNNFFLRQLDKWLYRQFRHIVTISQSAENSLRAHLGASFTNIMTIENGIDLNTITNAEPYNREELGLTPDQCILIQVSGFRYPKDQGTVIRSMERLNPDVHLLLVGDGPTIWECRKLAEDLRLLERVHFMGIRNDVPRLLKTADVVILSSHYEGLSLSSVEGLASGRPFIASAVPGLTEVVENAGLLFNVEDDKALADIIEKLNGDPSFYKETVVKGSKRSKEYDIEHMISSYLDLYNQMNDGKK